MLMALFRWKLIIIFVFSDFWFGHFYGTLFDSRENNQTLYICKVAHFSTSSQFKNKNLLVKIAATIGYIEP